MSADAARAQEVLADYLVVTEAVVTERLDRAFRSVGRHEFLPGTLLKDAYADRPVPVKAAPNGAPISSASQPTIVAQMLEMLDVIPGAAVLEIGTATGYNAALLDFLVAPDGSVTTVELEGDLAQRAGERLELLGCGRTRVVVGDGKAGFAADAPYDRIIVTAGARRIEQSWTDQLVEGGRLVVPVVDDQGAGHVVAFVMVEGSFEPSGSRRCAFLPLR